LITKVNLLPALPSSRMKGHSLRKLSELYYLRPYFFTYV
jgi:hypothetical protein